MKFSCVSLLIVIFAKKYIFEPRAYHKGDIPTHSFKNRTNLNLATFYYFKESHAMKNGRRSDDWSVIKNVIGYETSMTSFFSYVLHLFSEMLVTAKFVRADYLFNLHKTMSKRYVIYC